MIKLLTALLITASFSFHLFASTIVLVADEWCPYNCSPEAKDPGYMIEVAQRIFSSKGYQVIYRTMNWARAVKDTRNNTYDGVVGAYKGDAPDLLFTEEHLGISRSCFFAPIESKWKYEGLDSLKNQFVGVINNYSYGEELDTYFKTSSKVSVISGPIALERGLDMLKQKRIDIMVEDPAVFAYFIKNNPRFLLLFKQVGCLKRINKVYLAFSSTGANSHLYREIFAKGLKEMKHNGELKKILSKYQIETWF